MNVQILEKTQDMLRFILEDVDASFANAFRRVMIAEVPTFAIEDVIIIENTSALYDELLAHRLGLIPLKTDLESFVLPQDCGCGGTNCPRCSVTLTLVKEAKEIDNQGDSVIVYSGDLVSQDPEVVPVNDLIPIVKLAKGQRTELEAIAQLGKGKVHAKWQPVATCSYKYIPIIDLKKQECTECGDCVESCPKSILRLEEGGLIIQNMLDCILCKLCEDTCDFNAIKVRWDNRIFAFSVESTGALSPEKIVKKAVEILQGKAEAFKEEIELIQEGEKSEIYRSN
ncbi:DNA-directed RNA polymerase subunit D [Candidatus Borrarchaeum sp.]|uniref:DNA-directed RNA polymerase subunit D n=1 Tax=Candidatus Borrarchaeum sp. TaxID=2846742 RepID=UPI00257C68FB|nr:DNA-directed RNA polymerase subunit D [Candidatus Borrarchaeum sp.]